MKLNDWLTEEELREMKFAMDVLRSGVKCESDDDYKLFKDDGSIQKFPSGDEFQWFNDIVNNLFNTASKRYIAASQQLDVGSVWWL